jgi:hypothetical protein
MKSAQSLPQAARRTALPTLARLGGALALLAGLIFTSGCSTMSVQRDLDSILAMSPVPQMVPKGHELSAAEEAAAHVRGGQAFRGLGESMEPLYTSGTAIVVTPVDFTKLRKGMQVLYVNHDGFGVAHVLVGDLPGGWIAQGVGNKSEDEDLVTSRNLVGVITQVYASTMTTVWNQKVSRLAMNTVRSGSAPAATTLLASAN